MCIGKRADDRKCSAGHYRYGFNGKEKDADGEWGSSTHYDYGFRIYNPAIAKFLSIDPLSPDYPWYTPYQFAGNKPIKFIDVDGLEEGGTGWDALWWELKNYIFGGAIPFEDINNDEYIRRNRKAQQFGHALEDTKEKALKVVDAQMTFIELAPGGSLITYTIKGDRFEGTDSSTSLKSASFWLIVDAGTMGQGSKTKPLFRVTKQFADDLLEFTIKPLAEGLGRQVNQKIYGGSAKLVQNDDGLKILSLDFRIPKEISGKGVGTSLYEGAISHFGKENIDAIQGLWVVNKELYKDLPGNMSVNLGIYKKAIADGLSESDAAFKTITGQMAKKAGFTKATRVSREQGGQEVVEFLFSK